MADDALMVIRAGLLAFDVVPPEMLSLGIADQKRAGKSHSKGLRTTNRQDFASMEAEHERFPGCGP